MEKQEATNANQECQEPGTDDFPLARSYQLEALEIARKQNTIIYFPTGTGKSLVAVMLLRSYTYRIREHSSNVAVFLAPTVVLVCQQSRYVETFTQLKVGQCHGETGINYCDADVWKNAKEENEVLVMTPQVLLNALRHGFLKMKEIAVLIIDECHSATGEHPYACIMRDFYHHEHKLKSLELPRIFGMTASPIKKKALNSGAKYWKGISNLENLMNSKVFTCDDSILTQHVPFSTTKVKAYNHMDIPESTFNLLKHKLNELTEKHQLSLSTASISESTTGAAKKNFEKNQESLKKKLKMHRLNLEHCLYDLGVWLAMKAAEVDAGVNTSTWSKRRSLSEKAVRSFSLDAVKVFSESMPFGLKWSSDGDLTASMKAGYLTSRVVCLVETLLEYREMKNLRCIVFVERIITAIVMRTLLNEILSTICGWRTEYIAGNKFTWQSQNRKEQEAIVDEFREGKVNIIVATSMLEEGLDVQCCNLVIRFDPSPTICSFIQSKGLASMQNSDFILLIRSDDLSARSNVEKYVASEDIMRRESMSHADLPCEPLSVEVLEEPCYRVESTGASVTLSSSVGLLYTYCSRLPCDGFFKPYPQLTINKELRNCTLQLPNSCPIRTVTVEGNPKLLKHLACLEACKQLHQVGALTENLVPDVLKEEAETQELGYESYLDKCAKYIPPELVGTCGGESNTRYQCYQIRLQPKFQNDVELRDIVLLVHAKLDDDLEKLNLDLDVNSGKVIIDMRHIGELELNPLKVTVCQKFQITVFRVLLDHNLYKLHEELNLYSQRNGCMVFNYLLLPSCGSNPDTIDWACVTAGLYLERFSLDKHSNCLSPKSNGCYVQTKAHLVCPCVLDNCLVVTPHNGQAYCILGRLEGFDGNKHLELRVGESVTYKQYYKEQYGIQLQYPQETLLKAKSMFTVKNYLHKSRTSSSKEPTNTTCALPPELCLVVMSPISVSTFYSFSFTPAIMHWIESLLLASNLKRMTTDNWKDAAIIPTVKILEAITTKKCQEKFHLESLETLGDSFLKYAASQQVFCTYQDQHEGILSIKRSKVISNVSLCKLGCAREITGFIRNEPFHSRTWMVPGNNPSGHILKKETESCKIFYISGSREIKSKTVADVVEALIGAYLSTGGEMAALSFMAWLGIAVDFVNVPYARSFDVDLNLHVDVKYFKSLLNYSFRDATFLVEALTHGSYMLPEIPRCYQRLEFLGDAALDYLITIHLYRKYPDLTPGLLTDLRSASVNNDCYAKSAMKVKLYKHIIHASSDLQRQIMTAAQSFDKLPSVPTFGWESEATFPKVLADVIESLAGAILVDSGYDKDRVFQSMSHLLEPLVTPETLTLHPVRELSELCQKEHYILKKSEVSHQNGMAHATIEVDAGDFLYKETRCGEGKKIAKRRACSAILESLKGHKLQKKKKQKLLKKDSKNYRTRIICHFNKKLLC